MVVFRLNADNTRLRDIQLMKNICRNKIEASNSMYEMFKYQHLIDELEVEEVDILARCDVSL